MTLEVVLRLEFSDPYFTENANLDVYCIAVKSGDDKYFYFLEDTLQSEK